MLELKYIADYVPTYGTKDSACFDLRCINKTRIFPGELVTVSLGIKFEVPQGYYLEILPRSSLAKSGLLLANSMGVVDADYRGEVFAPLRNISKNKVIIEAGQRIVQGMLKKVEQIKLTKATTLSTTTRGTGGYGSTGKE